MSGMQVFQYLSVLCGMVGSMDTIAPDESIKDRLVFLCEDKNTLSLSVTCKTEHIFTKRVDYTFRRT